MSVGNGIGRIFADRLVTPPFRVMTMANLAALNKKIAALEAQAERVAKAEIRGAFARIRK